MKHDLDHVLASRMNEEPSILRGCSSTELMLVACCAVAVWLPIAIVLAFFIGAVSIGLAGALIVTTVYFGGGFFQKVKRGRPDGYYQHWVDLGLHKIGLRHSSFVVFEKGMPALGRTNK